MRMTVLLGGAIVVAAALGLARSYGNRGSGAGPERLVARAEPAQPDEAPASEDTPALGGTVLETLPVAKYTYLRLQSASGEIWAAVPRAKVAVGTRVTIVDASRMQDFESTTLKRTFKVIYFGNLQGSEASDTAPAPAGTADMGADDRGLPPGHPEIGGDLPELLGDDSETLPPGHPDVSGGDEHTGVAMGAAPSGPEPALPAQPIARAQGRGAHVISELAAESAQLAGQRVRVRGLVVKVTPNVRGRTYFHLRDGSLDTGGKIADLVATSTAEPKRGQIATFEGNLRGDVDVGIGYTYPVLLEDATIVGD